MPTPEYLSQERSRQLHLLLKDLQEQIHNLPNIYRPPLESSLNRLSRSLEAVDLTGGQAPSARRSATLEAPTEPAYLFGRDLPVPVMRQMEIVLDNLDSAVFVYDRVGIIRRTNARARAMLGRDPLGLSLEQFYQKVQAHNKDRQPLTLETCPVRRAMRGETVSREAFSVILPNGRAYSILVSAIPVLMQNEITGVVTVWNDVTELEQLAAQIEAERDQLKIILESISDEVWYADQERNIRLMNEQAGRNLGFDHPEAINQSPIAGLLDELEIFYPDGTPRPNDETPLLRSLKGEVNRGQEIVRTKRGGQTMFREYTSAPIRSRDQVVGAVSVVRDITWQKRQEEFLRASELRERARAAELYAVMNAVPAVIFVTHDSQARLVTGNRMAHQLMRVEEGHNFSKMVLPENSPGPYRVFHNGQELLPSELPLERCAATGEPVRDFEEDILFPDGSQIHLVGNVTPLFNENGQPTGAVAAYTDITERVQAEQALRASEQSLRESAFSLLESERVLAEANKRFRVALASAPITVFTMDRDLRYTWVYSQRHGLQGVPVAPDEQSLGKRDDELHPPEDVEELMELKRAVLTTGLPVQQEVMVRTRGDWSTFIITLDPLLEAQGEITGLTGSALDITQQRRLEMENLEQVAQMELQRRLLESREQERQELARDLHDGPIQILSGTLFTLQLQQDLARDTETTAGIGQVSAAVKSAIQELRDMVNELRPPATLRFGLASAIRTHAEEFAEKRPELDLALELTEELADLPEQLRLPEEVSLNLFRIYQEGLNNIVRHAQASQAWVRLSLEAGQILLEIRDNGRGFTVPTSLVERAQDRHYGLLGMAERCQTIGGKLEIISKPGQGTTIRAIIPKP